MCSVGCVLMYIVRQQLVKKIQKNCVQCQKRCQRTTGQNSVNVQCENFVSVQVCKCENISLHNTENFVNVQL